MGTYVLSLAAFKLSRNFKPAVVVESTDSAFEFDSACICAPEVSDQLPISVFLYSATVVCIAEGACGVGSRWRGGRRRWARWIFQVSRSYPRAMPHPHQALHRLSKPALTTQMPWRESARTLVFSRFPARPSFSPMTAVEALRLAALSMSPEFAIA